MKPSVLAVAGLSRNRSGGPTGDVSLVGQTSYDFGGIGVNPYILSVDVGAIAGDLVLIHHWQIYPRGIVSLETDTGMVLEDIVTPAGVSNYEPGLARGFVTVPGTFDVILTAGDTGGAGMIITVLRGASAVWDVAHPQSRTALTAVSPHVVPSFNTNASGSMAVVHLFCNDDDRPSCSTPGWDYRAQDDVGNSAAVVAVKQMPSPGATGDVAFPLGGTTPDTASYTQFAIGAT